MNKFSKIAAAVAAVCAAGAAQAYNPSTTPTDYRIVISGATATTVTLRDVILRDVCASNRDLYRYPASTVRYTIACTTAQGKNVLFMKEDGGSGTGTSPVDQKIAVSVLDAPSNTACAAATTLTSPFGTTYTDRNCGSTNSALLANRVPDFGMSDIEPDKFVNALAPSQGSFRNTSNMKVTTTSGLAFGVTASTNLYRALQVAQFDDASNCSPVPVAGTDGDSNGIKDAYEAAATDAVGSTGTHTNNHKFGDTEACMPTLTTAQVRSLFMDSAQGVASWDEFKAKGTDLVSLNATYAWGTAEATKFLCRRTSGSGTHAVTSIEFLQTQCGAGGTSGGQLMASGPNWQTPETSGGCGNQICDATLESTGSSGVVACLNKVNTDGFWGVGYSSLESNANLGSAMRFVKVDGHAPTLEAMVAGKYPFFGELTVQSRQQDNAADYTIANIPVAERTNAKNNWATIVAELSNAANVVTLNASNTFRHPFGNSGFLARGVPSSFSYDPADPIATQTHVNPATGVQNHCFGPITAEGVSVE